MNSETIKRKSEPPADEDVKRTECLLLDQLIRRNPKRAAKILRGIRASLDREPGKNGIDKRND